MLIQPTEESEQEDLLVMTQYGDQQAERHSINWKGLRPRSRGAERRFDALTLSICHRRHLGVRAEAAGGLGWVQDGGRIGADGSVSRPDDPLSRVVLFGPPQVPLQTSSSDDLRNPPPPPGGRSSFLMHDGI